MDELTTAPGIAALAAAALALLALAVALLARRRVRQLRAAQSVILGDGDGDLVAHAAGLQRRLDEIARELEQGIEKLEQADRGLADGLAGAVTHVAVIRYDAMGEMTGRLSSSVALLDSQGTGVVLSSIHSRDQARVYAKPLHAGRSDFELSPEEEEAIAAALHEAGP